MFAASASRLLSPPLRVEPRCFDVNAKQANRIRATCFVLFVRAALSADLNSLSDPLRSSEAAAALRRSLSRAIIKINVLLSAVGEELRRVELAITAPIRRVATRATTVYLVEYASVLDSAAVACSACRWWRRSAGGRCRISRSKCGGRVW